MKKLNALIVAPWYPAGPLRFISEAFERMGLGVYRVGATYNNHGNIDWGSDVVSPDIPLPREAPVWNIPILIDHARLEGFSPDFVLISEENYRTDIIPTVSIPTVFWTFDGWPNNFVRGEALNPTVKYINHPYGIRIHPRNEEKSGWGYMPAAYAPWRHPYKNNSRDIAFVLHATPYGKRPQLCDFLKKCGISVRDGWVTAEQYVDSYNRGAMTYHNANGQQECKYRLFEAAGMGCVNICDPTMLLERNDFWPYEHFIPIAAYPNKDGELWPKEDELADLVREWFGFGTLRAISDNARDLVMAKHTYYHRASQMLSDLGLGQIDVAEFIAKERNE